MTNQERAEEIVGQMSYLLPDTERARANVAALISAALDEAHRQGFQDAGAKIALLIRARGEDKRPL
jgi:hypothetical protein